MSSQTLPGSIPNLIFELKGDFEHSLEYDSDQIYEQTGGILQKILYRDIDTIKVQYIPYDHHNEPVQTSILKFEVGGWRIQDTDYDYSQTKYYYGSNYIISKETSIDTIMEYPDYVNSKEIVIVDETNMDDVVCMGCLEDQPNQLAHIGPNGCLGDYDI